MADAIFFMGHREIQLDDQQKADLLKFVHDDGKGFVAAHVALNAMMQSWPEFGEMMGGVYDEHPWGTAPGTIINEDPAFPATKHFPPTLSFTDEFYQVKGFSREKSRVLLRLDLSKMPANANVHVERRFSAGMGQDVRQGTGVLFLAGARRQDLGQPGCLSHVFRGYPMGAGHDRRRCDPEAGANSLTPCSILFHRYYESASSPMRQLGVSSGERK